MKRLLLNRALRVLLITNGLILFAGAMLGPIYALYVENIGGGLLDASLAWSFFALAAGITTLFAGKFSDKQARAEYVIAIGYLIIGVCFILYIFIDSIWALFGVEILIGFAEALYSPAFDALYSKHLSPTKAGMQWSAWESINYFTGAIGAAIGGLIASIYGFTTLFLLMSIFSFTSAIYIFYLERRVL